MFRKKRYLWTGIFYCSLAIALTTGCKKDAAEYFTSSQSALFNDSLHYSFFGPVIFSPSKSDTGIDVNTGIVVQTNSLMNATRLHVSTIILKKGAEIISGKAEYTDTSAVFIPDLNLEKNTTYNVEIKGLVNYTQDSELGSSVQGIDEKWSFTTASVEPEYIMKRQSQQVTRFARDGSKMMQMGEYLYLYGGWSADEFTQTSWNDVYRSKDDLTSWERIPDAPWSGRHTFGIGKLGSELYVFGGDHNNDVFDVWKSSDGENFIPIASDLATTVRKRFIYGACAHNNRLFVMGGQSKIYYPDSGLFDVWCSSNGLIWKKIADNELFLGKNLAGAVASFNGKIWVVGGGYYDDPDSSVRWTNHVYSSPDGITWKQENDAPWAGRQYADLCVWDNKLWMVGGHNGQNLAEIWYMSKDGSWTQYAPSNLFTARHATAVAVYNNKLVLACGNMNNECWVIEKNTMN